MQGKRQDKQAIGFQPRRTDGGRRDYGHLG